MSGGPRDSQAAGQKGRWDVAQPRGSPACFCFQAQGPSPLPTPQLSGSCQTPVSPPARSK